MISRDLLWKGIITSLVDDFLAFFFPEVFPLLDLEKGIEEGREEVIKQLLNNGLSLEELAELIQIPIEELEEIKRRTEEED